MSLADVDARIITAACLWVTGSILSIAALKVWWTHPVNRVFLFGPYLRAEGLALAIRGLPFLFISGLALLTSGISKYLHYLRWQGEATDEAASISGLVEAAFFLFVTGCLLVFVVKRGIRWLFQA